MTREEAIETVRRCCPRISDSKCDFEGAMRVLIPELAESEDEKAIKLIRSLLVNVRNVQSNTSLYKQYDDALAWLEKQKEPIPIPNKFSGLKSLMLQYLQSAANRKDDSEIESDTDLWGRKILDYVWKYSDEQKEQKPQMKLVYRMNGLMQDYIKDTKDPEEQEHRLKCYELFWEALEDADYFKQKDDDIRSEVYGSLNPPPKIPEQKPVEWSEEDEEALDMCLDAIPKRWKTKSGILLTKWLKDNIHLQSKQEWSEEDEHRITDAIYFLESAKIHYADTSEIEKTINFLKSLRPSWKPSEEQINALDFVIRFNKMGNWKEHIESLFNQLKKM